MDIKTKIFTTKINRFTLDPFGFCNSKCWYCPVTYQGNPEIGMKILSIADIRYILEQVSEERSREDGIFVPDFKHMRTAHFNEILLYPHLEELLELFSEFGLWTSILSNGINLTPEKTNLLKKYSHVVVYIGLNIPAYEKSLWARRTGFTEKKFDTMVSNVQYASEVFSDLVSQSRFTLHIDGIPENMMNNEIQLGHKFHELEYSTDEHATQLIFAQKLFPNIRANTYALLDRQGALSEYFTTSHIVKNNVTGCQSNDGDRSTEWISINANGDIFLCCHDYNFEYTIGNIKDASLRDLWLSDRHVDVVQKAYKNFCTKCEFAVCN